MRKMWIVLTGVLLASTVMGCSNVVIGKNEGKASANVRVMATAVEMYAANHGGAYPLDGSELTDYMSNFNSYNNQTVDGYHYSVYLVPTGYVIEARPTNCGTTGTKNFKAVTGGTLSEEECK